jgi:hypothetical protein
MGFDLRIDHDRHIIDVGLLENDRRCYRNGLL